MVYCVLQEVRHWQDGGMGMAGVSGIYGTETSRFVPQMLTKAVSAPAILKAACTSLVDFCIISPDCGRLCPTRLPIFTDQKNVWVSMAADMAV